MDANPRIGPATSWNLQYFREVEGGIEGGRGRQQFATGLHRPTASLCPDLPRRKTFKGSVSRDFRPTVYIFLGFEPIWATEKPA